MEDCPGSCDLAADRQYLIYDGNKYLYPCGENVNTAAEWYYSMMRFATAYSKY